MFTAWIVELIVTGDAAIYVVPLSLAFTYLTVRRSRRSHDASHP